MAKFDGTWETLATTVEGEKAGELVLATSGRTLTGQMKAAGEVMQVLEGRVNGGDKASWAMEATKPVPMILEVKVNLLGDSFSGNIKSSAIGSASVFTGKRKS